MRNLNGLKLAAVLTVLTLSSLACALLQAGPNQTGEIPAATQPVQPASKQPEPATVTPQNTATMAPTAGQKPNAYYEGISFYYDPSLAKGVSAQTMEASAPASDNLPFFAVNPKEYQFDFQGYLIPDGMKPQILVFSAKEYEQLLSGGGDPNPVTKKLTGFNKLIVDRPTVSSGDLPFLPVWNAAQLMHFQLKYIKFQNGEGIRYLTEFGQDVAPLSNKLLFYTFQGQTSDGAYYISAILPITHAKLPADNGETLSTQDHGKFMENYAAYVVDVQNMLNAEKGDTFNPTLDRLDALIASMKIDK
jgi:hypothetical protein